MSSVSWFTPQRVSTAPSLGPAQCQDLHSGLPCGGEPNHLVSSLTFQDAGSEAEQQASKSALQCEMLEVPSRGLNPAMLQHRPQRFLLLFLPLLILQSLLFLRS